MAKRIFYYAAIVLFYACTTKENNDQPGAEFLGNWHMEYIKDPKYPYYVYDYDISQNGTAFTVKIQVSCPKCKEPSSEEKTSTFSANFNAEKNVLEVQKNGFQELLTFQTEYKTLVSNRFTNKVFTKINK